MAEEDRAVRLLGQAGAHLLEHEAGERLGEAVGLRPGAETGAVETRPGESLFQRPGADQAVEGGLAGSERFAVGVAADAAEAVVRADDQGTVPVREPHRVPEHEAARRFPRGKRAAGGHRGDRALGDQRVAVGASGEQGLPPAVDVEVEAGVAAGGERGQKERQRERRRREDRCGGSAAAGAAGYPSRVGSNGNGAAAGAAVHGNSRSPFACPFEAIRLPCGAKPGRAVVGGFAPPPARIGAAAASLGRTRTPGDRPGFSGLRRRPENRQPEPGEASRPAVRSSPTSFVSAGFRFGRSP